jgi:hypothetical protein
VYIAIINIGLMEFDDVGMINLCQNGKLFLQELDILLNILFQDALDSILCNMWVTYSVSQTNRAKVPATKQLFEFVDCPDISCGEFLGNALENSTTGGCLLNWVLKGWKGGMACYLTDFLLWAP